MAISLAEYADELAQSSLRWPKAPDPVAVTAKPLSKPLPGIRGVIWNLYGTLLNITDGEFTFEPAQEIRLQVALDKTIHQFNMWNSMTRKPGAPWEYFIHKYRDVLSNLKMRGGPRGSVTEVDAVEIWDRLIAQLEQKDYAWDIPQYGDRDQYCEKIAYFFHSSLQGVGPYKDALAILKHVKKKQMHQGLLADAQSFSLVQLLRCLVTQGKLVPLNQLLDMDLLTLSYREGIRKPSSQLFDAAVRRCQSCGLEPDQVLYVSSRLRGDLELARGFGFKTVLFAGDKSSLEASQTLLKDPKTRPDRLVTELRQVSRIISD